MPESLFDTNLESKITLETESTPLPDDLPFRLLILGDWGGNSAFSAKSLAERRPIEIDRDEFDNVIRKIAPEIELRFEGSENNSLNLKFYSLDDFHPDNIFQQLPLFANLKDIRQKLKNPNTYDEAAMEVRSWYADSLSEKISEESFQETDSSASFVVEQENLLDQILDNKQENITVRRSTPRSELSEFVGNIVAPHIIKTDLEEQSKLLAIVDEVISDVMRKILHHEDFQRLESAWRGLYFVVRRIETDNNLKIFIAQITKVELMGNLSAVNALNDSELFRWVVNDDLVAGEIAPWAAIFGNYEFGSTVDEIAALIRIAKIAEAGKAPFISQLKPDIWGLDSLADSTDQRNWKILGQSSEYKLWTAARSIPESSHLGLAIPRFLGRLPYGYQTEPTEVFSFEEVTEQFKHTDYLWLNPCFAYAFVLAREYKINEWNIDQDKSFDIEDIPLHILHSEGSAKTKPGAEIEMTETGFNTVREQGLMTLISFRDSDRLRLSALRSISETTPSLKGKWSS